MVRGYLLSLVLGRRDLPGVRRACTVAMALLAIQLCAGMIVNLYVAVPAADSTASILQDVETAPTWLTLHALVGLALLAAGIVLVARAIGTRRRGIIGLAAAGLLALLGAFGAGEVFIRDGRSTASLSMALLTGLALLCYVAVQAIAGADRKAGTGGKQARGDRARVFLPRPRPASGTAGHRGRAGSSAEG